MLLCDETNIFTLSLSYDHLKYIVQDKHPHVVKNISIKRSFYIENISKCFYLIPKNVEIETLHLPFLSINITLLSICCNLLNSTINPGEIS